eukprot:TRINITY_DN3256_c0_g1_i1.p1 TRINITY_DN3256_c0_g1~~TRINITY_DN3256_c0_g1_i1.p1  ORF type:complete len:495 (-),score=93.38 TRINITY_DN3256_c0_g1_i1:543-2027(-)
MASLPSCRQEPVIFKDENDHQESLDRPKEDMADASTNTNEVLLKTGSMSLAFASNTAVYRKLSFQPPIALPRRPPTVSRLPSSQTKAILSTSWRTPTKQTKPSKTVNVPKPEPPKNLPSDSGVKDFLLVSAFPDFHKLGHDRGNPSKGGALRKAVMVWFRNDLRVHDNEALSAANRESLSILPVYCFDPRDYGKSSSGFDKTGPFRANFLLQCVSNLRENLRNLGSDLVVRIGRPEEVLVELAKEVGADALYVHQEVSHEELVAEKKIYSALQDEGVETKFFWGSTLYHIDDLPFKLEDMPSNYGGFRDKVQRLKVRDTMSAPRHLKGLPIRGSVQCGEIPSLLDLGLNPQVVQNGRTNTNASLVGGESEALQRLKMFASECRKPPNDSSKDVSSSSSRESLYGANFSCKISPWLAMGCLSPRFIFEELMKGTNMPHFASLKSFSRNSSDNGGQNWLLFELLWRDFFRFITKKYSAARIQNVVPTTACAGALAV